MIGGTLTVADGQAVLDGLREVGLCSLHRIGKGFPLREMRRDGGRKGATGAVGVGGVDELPFEDLEESAVVEEVRRTINRQMAALDEDIGASELMDDFGRAPGISQGSDLDARKLLSLVHIGRD